MLDVAPRPTQVTRPTTITMNASTIQICIQRGSSRNVIVQPSSIRCGLHYTYDAHLPSIGQNVMRPPNREPSWFGCQCMGCLALSAVAALLTTCVFVLIAGLGGDLVSGPGRTPPEESPNLDWTTWMLLGLTATYAIIGAAFWVKWRR